jgi:AraC-like DNA-binding protein
MLVYSNRSISETAYALGFSTVHNFSRAFSQVTGMSPGAYRRGKTG